MPVLSNKVVSALSRLARAYVAYDSKLPGFGCRVTPTGAKSWIVEYRPHGGGRRVAKRRMTLGPVSTVPADAARKLAGTLLARARLGEDVAGEKIARRRALTFSELVVRFMVEEIRPLRKASTADLYDMQFRLHVVPNLGTMRAVDVTRSHVARLHRAVGERTPATANRIVTLISGLYSWAASVGEVPDGLNPAKGVARYREEGCERYLSLEEFRRLGDAMRTAEAGLPWTVDESKPTAKHARKPENRFTQVSPFAIAAIKLLLLTGCRLREILNLEWEHVDFDRAMLFLPDSKTGRKPVLLSAAAISVLEDIPRFGRFVIAGATANCPRRDLKRPWRALVCYAGLRNVRLHDLRHSFAAVGAGAGLGLPIIGKLLGHRNLETTNRYAHIDAHPLRVAANRIATEVSNAMGEGNESFALEPLAPADVERQGRSLPEVRTRLSEDSRRRQADERHLAVALKSPADSISSVPES